MALQGVFWLSVPTNAQAPVRTGVSRGSLVQDITVPEQQAIDSGSIREELFDTGFYAIGTTKAQIQADIVTRFNASQTATTAKNPALRAIGGFFDSVTGWSF